MAASKLLDWPCSGLSTTNLGTAHACVHVSHCTARTHTSGFTCGSCLGSRRGRSACVDNFIKNIKISLSLPLFCSMGISGFFNPCGEGLQQDYVPQSVPLIDVFSLRSRCKQRVVFQVFKASCGDDVYKCSFPLLLFQYTFQGSVDNEYNRRKKMRRKLFIVSFFCLLYHQLFSHMNQI